MYDTTTDELGPIDFLVIVFPARTTSFAGAMATELASLVDAELIRVLDFVVVEKGAHGTCGVREFEDLRASEALGDLNALEGQLAEVLALQDLQCVAASLDEGTSAAILVLENTWAAPFVDAARRSGGQLAADGRIPMDELVGALNPTPRLLDAEHPDGGMTLRPGRIGRPGVIARPLRRTVNAAGAGTAVIQGVARRSEPKL